MDLTLAEVGSETERRINAFAIHLLLLRNSVVQQWRLWAGEPREKAIRLGVEYRVSWSALCGQLKEDLPQLDAVPVEALQREFDSLP